MTRDEIEKRLAQLGAETRGRGVYRFGESATAELWNSALALNTISKGKLVSFVVIDYPAVRDIRRDGYGKLIINAYEALVAAGGED